MEHKCVAGRFTCSEDWMCSDCREHARARADLELARMRAETQQLRYGRTPFTVTKPVMVETRTVIVREDPLDRINREIEESRKRNEERQRQYEAEANVAFVNLVAGLTAGALGWAFSKNEEPSKPQPKPKSPSRFGRK